MHINIKQGPFTLDRLQGPFEASIMNLRNWDITARMLQKFTDEFGYRAPQSITRREIDAWLEKKSQHYAPNSIKTMRSAISRFYTWMMHMEVPGVISNPCWRFGVYSMNVIPERVRPLFLS